MENREFLSREDVLAKAKMCVCGDREQDYGSPESNIGRIATFWSVYLGIPIRDKDVAAMMCLLKISRIVSGHAKSDNWVDLAGYAALGGELDVSDG